MSASFLIGYACNCVQSWAITYHGLLTLLWLVGACSLWVLPDTRKYTLRLTPVICAYALLLVLLQYSCFLVLRVPAVAGSFLNDGVNEVLRTFGGHRDSQPPAAAASTPAPLAPLATALSAPLADNGTHAAGGPVAGARAAVAAAPPLKSDATIAKNFTDLANLLGFYPQPSLEFLTLAAQVCQ